MIVVLPRFLNSSSHRAHLAAKRSSPTASASSTSRMSGSTRIAAANASRIAMPVEYVRIGASMNSPSSENSITSSSWRLASRRSRPERQQLDHGVFAAGKIRIESRAEREQRREVPAHPYFAAIRLRYAAENAQQGRFAGAVLADHSQRLSPRQRKRYVVECIHDAEAPVVPDAPHDEILQRGLLRGGTKAEALRDADGVDGVLAQGWHACRIRCSMVGGPPGGR